MSTLCWFPFFAQDWLGSNEVAMMNDAQKVAYLNLLCRQWMANDSKLPDSIDKLSLLAGRDMSTSEMKVVLDMFPSCEGGRANVDLAAKYQAQLKLYEGRVARGRKGGLSSSNARSHAGSSANSCAQASLSGSGYISDSASHTEYVPPMDSTYRTRRPKLRV